jgi:hypothetical protein
MDAIGTIKHDSNETIAMQLKTGFYEQLAYNSPIELPIWANWVNRHIFADINSTNRWEKVVDPYHRLIG